MVLNGSMNGDATLWSKDIQDKQTNYMQVKLQILSGTEDCGIVWKDTDNKEYYARLGHDDLEFSEIPSGDSNNRSVITEAKTGAMEKMKQYTMRAIVY